MTVAKHVGPPPPRRLLGHSQECVSGLVEALFEGYNATVLAYGPTGSGKSYTMGTGASLHMTQEQQGAIPRAIRCDPALTRPLQPPGGGQGAQGVGLGALCGAPTWLPRRSAAAGQGPVLPRGERPPLRLVPSASVLAGNCTMA